MKYPAIYGNGLGCNILWFNENKGVSLDDGGLVCKGSTSKYVNITHKYLSNTWGVVESKEHSEFIIELAELHGFSVWKSNKIKASGDIKMFFFDSEEDEVQFYHQDITNSVSEFEQITIPLPPKAESKEINNIKWEDGGENKKRQEHTIFLNQ